MHLDVTGAPTQGRGYRPAPGPYPRRSVTDAGTYASDIPDDIVYQWAVDYFNSPDADPKVERKQVHRTQDIKSGKSVSRPAAPVQPNKAPAPVGETYEQMSLLGGDGR